MRNFLAIDEKGGVREFIVNDLSNVGLRVDTNKHRHVTSSQTSPHMSKPHPHSRVFNVSFHQMDCTSVRVDDIDLTVPIFLRWCFDCIRRSIKNEGLFRKSGGSQRIKELMARIEEGSLTPSLSSSNTVFDVCSLFKEFLRRLTYPLITHPLQDLLLDCFSMRSLSAEKKVDMYFNILLLLPDEHLNALIYILRFLHEITLSERENKMNAKNLAICVGPGIMRTPVDGKASIMTEQCATNVSDIVETLILHAGKLGYVTESVYDRSQMLLEMRQKEAAQHADESFAMENGMKYGIGGGKVHDPANAKKRRSGSVKEFLVHMTNRLRRRSGSNNESRDHTNAFLDQSGKLSSSHSREHRHHYQYHQQNSLSEQGSTTSKRKSSDDPNGSNSKRGKIRTSTQEKSTLHNANRFTSPLTAFRRKKKTLSHNNDPGFPFKIEHSHLPQLLHFTDEVPLRFTNNGVNPASSVSSSSSSLSTTTPGSSMTTLTTSIVSNGSMARAALPPLSMEAQAPLLSNLTTMSCNNKSMDAKKLNLLDSWKWSKSSRKAERKPLIAIHAPMLATSTIDSSSLAELCPSPIKATDDCSQQIGSSSLLMHTSFGVHRHHSDDVTNASFSTTTFRPRRSISSSSGQPQTRHIPCGLDSQCQGTDERSQPTNSRPDRFSHEKDSFENDDEDEETANELNLAVVDGNEDAQSLRGGSADHLHHENNSLDVAFIDENDLERNLNRNIATESPDRGCAQSNAMDVQSSSVDRKENDTLSQTMVAHWEQEKHNSMAMEDDTHEPFVARPVLAERSLNREHDLDEILRQNEHRSIRLTDSDDEEHGNFQLVAARLTPEKDFKTMELKSKTPTMPVRLSSSISSLLTFDSSMALPLPRSACKERSFSCSSSQAANEVLNASTARWISLNLAENDENTSVLNGGRESILVLQDKLAGRVSRQVRAFEQRTTETSQNRSIVSDRRSSADPSDLKHPRHTFTAPPTNTPEQRLIEDALTRGKKIVLSSNGTSEVARSVKRLQNTPIRRWRERTKELEKRRQLTPPYHLFRRKRKHPHD